MAGIKTNISLFQRILRDADFQAGKLDTGYLDRLLAKAQSGGRRTSRTASRSTGDDRRDRRRNVCGARPGFAANKNGDAAGERQLPVLSNWKQKGRSEALR